MEEIIKKVERMVADLKALRADVEARIDTCRAGNFSLRWQMSSIDDALYALHWHLRERYR